MISGVLEITSSAPSLQAFSLTFNHFLMISSSINDLYLGRSVPNQLQQRPVALLEIYLFILSHSRKNIVIDVCDLLQM